MPQLNFVAELDGKLVGHIIYSTSKIIDTNGKEHEMLTFGPLSVLPKHQSMGIGKALMRHTFVEAKRLGYRAVIIFGHPDYYPRVGFRRASEFGVTGPDGKSFDALMVYPLYDGALDGIQGRYHIDPVYESITKEDVAEFDKKFPPKELYKPIPMEVLLNRLPPAAREALKSVEGKALKYITTRSEDSMLAKDGIDVQAIEIIRSTMHEHGFSWGKPQ